MRKGIMIVLLCSLAIACGKKQLPKGILSRDRMEAVMWDMLQADEFLKDFMLNRDSTLNDTTESIRMYEKVFAYNKTTREEFANSFNYYRTHTRLFQEVMDSLNLKSTETAPSEIYKPPVDSSQLTDSNRGRVDSIRRELKVPPVKENF